MECLTIVVAVVVVTLITFTVEIVIRYFRRAKMGIFDRNPNIERLKEKKVKGLMRDALKGNRQVRKEAAEALGDIGDARAVKPLSKALKDKERTVQWEATEALGKIGDARAVEPLSQALKDEDSKVRRAAEKALVDIGDTRAVEPFAKSLKDEDKDVRGAAKEPLERLETKEKPSSKQKTTSRQGKTVSELVDEGASHGTHGEHEAALSCFNEALELNPRYALAWFNKGATLERLERYEEALWCFNEALKIDPALPRPPLRWRCPKCAAVLEDEEFNRGWAGHSGTVVCSVCGKQHPAGNVHGGKYDIKPRKPKD